MSNKTNRRIGKFRINREVMDNWRQANGLLTNVFVLRCEFMEADRCFHYVALCDEFEEVQLGEEPPEYEVIVTTHGDGSQTDFRFRLNEFATVSKRLRALDFSKTEARSAP
jgi:hypothetical protein